MSLSQGEPSSLVFVLVAVMENTRAHYWRGDCRHQNERRGRTRYAAGPLTQPHERARGLCAPLGGAAGRSTPPRESASSTKSLKRAPSADESRGKLFGTLTARAGQKKKGKCCTASRLTLPRLSVHSKQGRGSLPPTGTEAATCATTR